MAPHLEKSQELGCNGKVEELLDSRSSGHAVWYVKMVTDRLDSQEQAARLVVLVLWENALFIRGVLF